MKWYNNLPIMSPKRKKQEIEDPFRKNAHKKTDYTCVNCPKCDQIITYKESAEHHTIVCPWCKRFFVPSSNIKPRVVPFWIQQSPSEWLEM